jgi:hypothetical protein
MLTGAEGNGAEVGKLAVFAGVREFPSRITCATLAWHALQAASTGPPSPSRPNRQQGGTYSRPGHDRARGRRGLRTCYDPEIPVDIYELGLLYGVTVVPDGAVHVHMTLTSPNCPAAQELPADVEKVRAVLGVTDTPGRDRLRSDLGQLQDVRRRQTSAWPALTRGRVTSSGCSDR